MLVECDTSVVSGDREVAGSMLPGRFVLLRRFFENAGKWFGRTVYWQYICNETITQSIVKP